MRHRYFDRQGNPLTDAEWYNRAADYDNSVKKTEVAGINVSTIHLGLNHQYGDGPPLIFETMCFGSAKKCECCGQDLPDSYDACFRYSTEAEAIAHHDELVKAIEAGVRGEDLPEPHAQKGEQHGE